MSNASNLSFRYAGLQPRNRDALFYMRADYACFPGGYSLASAWIGKARAWLPAGRASFFARFQFVRTPRLGSEFPDVGLFAKKSITFRSRDNDVSNTREALDQFIPDETADCSDGNAETVCRGRQLKSATLNERNGIYSALPIR